MKEETLDELLDALCRYGNPRLSRTHTGKWHAVCMLSVNVPAELKVASDFGHATAAEALRLCLQRTAETVHKLEFPK